MNDQHLTGIPLQPRRQLFLANLQLRTDLVEAVLPIEILGQRLVVNEIFVFVLVLLLQVHHGPGTRARTAPKWYGPRRREHAFVSAIVVVVVVVIVIVVLADALGASEPFSPRARGVGEAEPADAVEGGGCGGRGTRGRWCRCGLACGNRVLVHAVQETLDDAEGDEAADVDVC